MGDFRGRFKRNFKRKAGEAGCDTLECCGESAECGPDCDCLSLMFSLTTVFAVLGTALRARPVDPHTVAPRSWAGRVAWRLIRAYQVRVSARRASPVCPMTPSCSRYGLQAISRHGLVRGGWLTARRLRRCSRKNAGYDPVPA